MNNAFDHIEAYFNGSLSAGEKVAFEERCVSDPAFAEEVALYVSLRDGLKQEFHAQKKAQFAELHHRLAAARPSQGIVRFIRPAIALAAACLLLFWVWTTFLNKPSAQTLAGNYIQTHFTTLGLTMGTDSADRFQAGIAAYNNKNFSEAEKIFQSLQQQSSLQPEAVKYLGILYLTTGNYDKALVQFDTLSRNTQLYANPGLFYKALTLLKRSARGDKETARTLLEEVIQKQLPGSNEATEWIKTL
jgi:tetratricopeptide (TPR) repeat protein